MEIENTSTACHICGVQALDIFDGYDAFSQVTSDSRSWRSGSNIAICRSCSSVQKVIDDQWKHTANEIYKHYEIYSQAGGEEQRIFDQSTGIAKSRSEYLIDGLLVNFSLPKSGRLLDVGCGNGALLRAFSEAVSGWQLSGFEIDDKHRVTVEDIPGVEAFYTGEIGDIPGQFDVIFMVHVLEHIPEPVNFIKRIKQKLKAGGLLIIEVPNLAANPFDLLIADHCTHFTKQTLSEAMEMAGFRVVFAETSLVPKEISLVACEDNGEWLNKDSKMDKKLSNDNGLARDHMRWLKAFLEKAQEVEGEAFGVFGTSIVATWLAGELEDKIKFFVDEDSSRQGTQFFGKPVLSPDEVPEVATVFLGLPSLAAENVYARLCNSKFKIVCPPPYYV